jgi:iron complex transport system substrate-binding protein
MKRKFLNGTFLACFAFFMLSCGPEKANKAPLPAGENARIVCLNGATTEIICELGLQDKLVGVDATSNFPPSVDTIPKVGYGKAIAAEKVLALNPTLVIGAEGNVKPELLEQLKATHVKVLLFKEDFSIQGTKNLINGIADSLQIKGKKERILAQIDEDLSKKELLKTKPKVLFIYARGAGTLTVCGKNTAPQSIIELAGGENAINDFENYKPLTSEALVAGNPDVILMFDSGLESLGGMDGLLKIPGVAQTNAGKNRKVIEMEGQYLTGFGPRVGKAITELSGKISED